MKKMTREQAVKFCFNNYTYKELADITKTNVGTIGAQKHRFMCGEWSIEAQIDFIRHFGFKETRPALYTIEKF
jgi:hypothetical protein